MKQHFIEAHEELIEEFLEANPHMTWDQAYDLMADAAYDRMRDKLFDQADALRQRQKDENQ